MPELPEVETVRRGLLEVLVGRRIDDTRVTGTRTVRRQDRAELMARTIGTTVTDVRRIAKYLVADLDSGDVLVAHLRMSGQLLHGPADGPLAPHTHARFWLDDGNELRFVDPRTFGELFAVDPADLPAVAPTLLEVGFDPLTGMVTVPALAAALARRRTPLKVWLLDQRNVAGVGNIYSDEICALARIDPLRRSDTLTRPQIKRLHEAIGAIIAAAVEARGSSLRDAQYVDLMGQSGSYQERFRVYGREGLPCHGCGRPVVRRVIAQRSSYSCPRCQR